MHDLSLIDELLQLYRTELGPDLPRYRNHVCRVYTYCLLLDPSPANRESYAIAAVFHDIGIWTAHTIDYLQPSVVQARKYLADHDKKELVDDITRMIDWHHKTTRYKGQSEQLVETFRQADWIDVTLGLISFGISRKKIRAYRKQFPTLGFHRFLLKKILKNLFVHPLRPLPMFRR